jgi:aryl-alcohol dehydrogenase-like predicted oxidoreductase
LSGLKKRRLGRTELMVTELGLGAMDTPQAAEGAETIHLALEMGINFIDTARIYEGSESLIGEVIRARGGKSFYIASKTINRTIDGSQYDVDRSLSLLGVDRIDLYQLDDVLPKDWDAVLDEEHGALTGLKTAQFRGLIGHIGISSHSMDVLEKAISCGQFDTVMLEYSAFFQDAESLIPLANEQDVGVIVMRPLGGSGRMSSVRSGSGVTEPLHSLTPAALLRYVLSNPGVSVAIPGVRFPSRIRDNVELASTYAPMDTSETSDCETEARRLFQD